MIRIWPFGVSHSTAYSVHEPPENEGTPLERAENLVFVAEGFSWAAALFGPIYLAIKRQWIALAVYLAGIVTLVNVLNLAAAPQHWISWACLLFNVILGFEMSNIHRSSLSRAGWRDLGTVSGISAEEAERRFFATWLAAAPTPAEVQTSGAATSFSATTPGQASVSEAHSLLHRLSSRLTRKSAPGT